MSAVADRLRDIGLAQLIPWAEQMLIRGMTSDEFYIELTHRPEYKSRFIGNELRRARGLPALPESVYVAEEAVYRERLRNAGIDPSAFDSPDDFASLLAQDIRGDEFARRIQIARAATQSAPRVKEAFARALGQDLSDDDVIDLALGNRPDLAQEYSAATGTALFTSEISDLRGTLFDTQQALAREDFNVHDPAALASLTSQRERRVRQLERAKEMLATARTDSAKRIWRSRVERRTETLAELDERIGRVRRGLDTFRATQTSLTAAEEAEDRRLASIDPAGALPLADLERELGRISAEEAGLFSSGGSVARPRTLREATF